jgi:multicomponent Na+:H+ antiporter subunit D
MTPDLLIVASLLLPVIGAIVSLALRGHAAPVVVTAVLGFASAIALVATTADGSVEALHVGNWPAPFGIVLVADGFAALMLAVCQLVLVASMIFSITTLPAHFKRRHLFPLLSTLSLGANGAFLTGDLFNLYVWFEVLLLSSFSIMAMVPGAAAKQATWRYVVINLVASLLFLIAAGLIYGKTGTLNFADLHLRFQSAQSSFLIESSTALLFGAFGIKAALIPLAFWLPKSYPHLPPALPFSPPSSPRSASTPSTASSAWSSSSMANSLIKTSSSGSPSSRWSVEFSVPLPKATCAASSPSISSARSAIWPSPSPSLVRSQWPPVSFTSSTTSS